MLLKSYPSDNISDSEKPRRRPTTAAAPVTTPEATNAPEPTTPEATNAPEPTNAPQARGMGKRRKGINAFLFVFPQLIVETLV